MILTEFLPTQIFPAQILPEGLTGAALGYIVLCFFIAGLVKGVVGVGMPTVIMGLTTLVIEPRLGIILLLWPILISNAWQIWRTGDTWAALYRYRWFIGALLPFVALTVLFSGDAPARLFYAIAGVVIILYVAAQVLFRPPAIPARWDRTAQLLFGTIAGVLGGLSSMWAVPTAIYLTGSRVDKDQFVRATGIILFLGSVALCLSFWLGGSVTWGLSGLSFALLAPTLLGYTAGEHLRGHIPNAAFMRVLYGVFLVLGANLLRKAIWG